MTISEPLLLTVSKTITQLITEHFHRPFIQLHGSIQKKKSLFFILLYWNAPVKLVAVLALGTELKSKSHTQPLPLTILKKHFPLFRISSLAQSVLRENGDLLLLLIHTRDLPQIEETLKNHDENCLAVHLLWIQWLMILTKICLP